MAMRGRGNLNRPPRVTVNRVYEQFKPMSEWRQEDGYDILLVYLPGFQKEYIKVTTENVNIVRVRGERLVAENKWSRFQEDYRVPENCEMRGIRARFEGGILTITMPRKIINAPLPQPNTTVTDRVAPKIVAQPQKPKEEPKEKKPDKPQTSHLEDNTLSTQPKPTSSPTPAKPSKPKTSRLEDNTLPPQPKPKSSSTPTKPDKPETSRLKDNTLPPRPKPKSSSTPTKPDKPHTSRFEDNTLPPQPKPTSSSTLTKPSPSKPVSLDRRLDQGLCDRTPVPLNCTRFSTSLS